MRSKCLQNKGKFRNLSGQKWCLQHHPALTKSRPVEEVRHMADEANITLRCDSASVEISVGK